MARRRTLLAAGLCAALSLAQPLPAAAWTEATRQAMAEHAARIAPPLLARQIERRMAFYRQGVVEGNPPPRGGGLEIERATAAASGEAAAAIAAIRAHRPFDEVVERLGRLAGLVAAANEPLAASDADRGEAGYRADWERYVDSARPRFAVLYYGAGRDARTGEDYERLLAATAARGLRLYPSVGREYRRIGRVAGRQLFDDRSTAFAVAALAFSHGVSDAAAALRYVWLAAGGGDPRTYLPADEGRLVLLAPGALPTPR